MRQLVFVVVLLVGATNSTAAEQVDSLVSVRLDNELEQRGVLTTIKGDSPSALVLLFPGEPAVLKAEVVDSKLVNTRLAGSPLVRARNLLVRPGLGAVLVDCRSDYQEHCSESYIMSKDRFEDVRKLVSELKQKHPGVKKVWIVGHSLGSLASASLARYGENVFDGAIHASTILASKATYKSLVRFDFSTTRVPQLFIHHRNDPCPGTPLFEAEAAAARYKIPLVIISEAGGVRERGCQPFSEHGFAGAEQQLMQTIYDAIEGGVDQFNRRN